MRISGGGDDRLSIESKDDAGELQSALSNTLRTKDSVFESCESPVIKSGRRRRVEVVCYSSGVACMYSTQQHQMKLFSKRTNNDVGTRKFLDDAGYNDIIPTSSLIPPRSA